jgi:hypothetical protein
MKSTKTYRITYVYDMQINREEIFTTKKEALKEFKYYNSKKRSIYSHVQLFESIYKKIKTK